MQAASNAVNELALATQTTVLAGGCADAEGIERDRPRDRRTGL